MSATLTDKDNGYDAITKALEELVTMNVKVGVFGDKGSAAHTSGLTVAEIAAQHELGIDVPQRSWLGAYIDQNSSKLLDLLENAIIAFLKSKGKKSLEDSLKQIGLFAVGEIQERISSSIPPPNAPMTVLRKGSDTTLIDTGQFRSSIASELVKGEVK